MSDPFRGGLSQNSFKIGVGLPFRPLLNPPKRKRDLHPSCHVTLPFALRPTPQMLLQRFGSTKHTSPYSPHKIPKRVHLVTSVSPEPPPKKKKNLSPPSGWASLAGADVSRCRALRCALAFEAPAWRGRRSRRPGEALKPWEFGCAFGAPKSRSFLLASVV